MASCRAVSVPAGQSWPPTRVLAGLLQGSLGYDRDVNAAGKWDINHFKPQLWWVLMALIHCVETLYRGRKTLPPQVWTILQHMPCSTRADLMCVIIVYTASARGINGHPVTLHTAHTGQELHSTLGTKLPSSRSWQPAGHICRSGGDNAEAPRRAPRPSTG